MTSSPHPSSSSSSFPSNPHLRQHDDSSADEGEDADEFYDPQEYSSAPPPPPAASAVAFKPSLPIPSASLRPDDADPARALDSSTRSTRSQSSASQSSSLSHHHEPASPSPDATSAVAGGGDAAAVRKEGGKEMSPSSSPVPPVHVSPNIPARPARTAPPQSIATGGALFTPSPSPALATPSSSSSSGSSSLHSHHARSSSFNLTQTVGSPSHSHGNAVSAPVAPAASHHSASTGTSSPLAASASSASSILSTTAILSPPTHPSSLNVHTAPHSSSSPPLPLGASLSSSPLPPLTIPSTPSGPSSLTRPHSPPSSSLSSSQPHAHPPDLVIRNLDTNESVAIDQATTFFPEIAQAMTVGQLEALERQMSDVKMREKKDEDGDGVGRMSESEVVERRKTLGFLGKLAKTWNMGGGGAAAAGKGKDGEGRVKVKAKHCDVDVLSELSSVQTIVEHAGPIWCVSVSHDGQFIATGGQDSIVRVWTIVGSIAQKQAEAKAAQLAAAAAAAGQTPPPSSHSSTPHSASHSSSTNPDDYHHLLLHPVPYRIYSGHRADVTSLDWSKDENFLLSASIDKTVRLWHVASSRCIRVFPHTDFITSIAFHPIQHRYFISGSFDNRIRLWNILEHRVVEWAQTAHFVTAVAFSPSGQMVVAGLHHGQCVFYQTSGLKYYTQIDCRNRAGKHKRGKKVTGLEYSRDGKLLLVTTNDSRVRCYRLVDFSLVSKMKGVENEQLQIKATFSEDGQHVIMGSDKEYVAVWKMPPGDKDKAASTTSPTSSPSPSAASASSPTNLKTDAFEYFKALDDTVTCAVFLPRSSIAYSSAGEPMNAMPVRNIVLTTGLNGEIKLFESRFIRPTGVQHSRR